MMAYVSATSTVACVTRRTQSYYKEGFEAAKSSETPLCVTFYCGRKKLTEDRVTKLATLVNKDNVVTLNACVMYKTTNDCVDEWRDLSGDALTSEVTYARKSIARKAPHACEGLANEIALCTLSAIRNLFRDEILTIAEINARFPCIKDIHFVHWLPLLRSLAGPDEDVVIFNPRYVDHRLMADVRLGVRKVCSSKICDHVVALHRIDAPPQCSDQPFAWYDNDLEARLNGKCSIRTASSFAMNEHVPEANAESILIAVVPTSSTLYKQVISRQEKHGSAYMSSYDIGQCKKGTPFTLYESGTNLTCSKCLHLFPEVYGCNCEDECGRKLCDGVFCKECAANF